jgi:8-oxo-dGTP pyrophosphatase MutT (NUDIX family)
MSKVDKGKGIKPDEPLYKAASRELREETDIKLQMKPDQYYDYKGHTRIYYLYVNQEYPVKLSHEHDESGRFLVADLLKNMDMLAPYCANSLNGMQQKGIKF